MTTPRPQQHRHKNQRAFTNLTTTSIYIPSANLAETHALLAQYREADPTSGPTYNHHHTEEEKQQPFVAIGIEKEIKSVEPWQSKDVRIRANVFVSKQSTQDLTQFAVDEHWGVGNHLLFKYLDYIFRCQMFAHQVKRITYSDGDEIMVLHSGLQRRGDYEFLFLILRSNDKETPKWRLPAGNIGDSCLSLKQLTDRYLLTGNDVPKRCKFYKSSQELVFDVTHSIELNLNTVLGSNKRRIFGELKMAQTAQLSKLEDAFDAALLRSMNIIKVNPRLVVPQLFIDTENQKTHVQLLLPLIIRYPRASNQRVVFALTLEKKSGNSHYVAADVLTHSMAYTNARLVGYVDSSWLNSNGL